MDQKPMFVLQQTIDRFAPRIKSFTRFVRLGDFDEEDLLQEVWKKLAKTSPTFSWDSSDGIGVILATAKNIVIDKIRRSKRMQSSATTACRVPISLPGSSTANTTLLDEATGQWESPPAEECMTNETVEIVRDAIQKLSVQDQTLIWRRHFQPRKMLMSMSQNERVRLHRALKKLEAILRNDPRLKSLLG